MTKTKKPQVSAAAASAVASVANVQSRSLWNIWVASFFLKVLLFPTYHSTDFDVHRNWLAITNKLPLSEWYYEKTSQWTLDYPPFFAYFEYVLSQFVPKIVAEDGCLDIVEVGNYGMPTVYFQRLTVIVSEVFLFAMLQWYINSSQNAAESKRAFVVASSIALSPGFLIIDHIHFQYNGFLFAFIVGSIVAVKLNRPLLCGFFFMTALCFKHIFLYLAPAYFVFLLSSYCMKFPKKMNFWDYLNVFKLLRSVQWLNLIKLGSLVVGIFLLAFGPFIYLNQIPQLLQRLFPFSRGLTHAYWAPNVWALYSFSDRVLAQLSLKVSFFSTFMLKLGYKNLNREVILQKLASANTKGLVQDVFFTILPNITPQVTFALTLFYQVVSLIPLFISPTYKRFLGCLTLCGYSSFLFGWHVHEKAILLVIIPYTFLVVNDRRFLTGFQALVAAGYVSLFPLLFTPELWFLKCIYTHVWLLLFFASFKEVCVISTSLNRRIFLFDRGTMIYIIGLAPLIIACGALDALGERAGALGRLQFFRLMTISVYCSVGVVASWFGLSWLYFCDELLWT